MTPAADEPAAAAAAAAAEALRVQVIPPPSIDPTTATKESMLREIEQLEKSFDRRLRSVENELEVRLKMREDIVDQQLAVRDERLAGIDEATKLRLAGIESIPGQIDEKVERLKEVSEEKFASVQTQFKERDTRSERESRDNKLAVDAAFAAQEKQAAAQNKSNAEAIGKSEAATTDSINKNATQFQSALGAIASTMSDLKDRVGDIEKTSQASLSAMEARLEKRISEVSSVANGYGQQKVGATDSRAIIGWVIGAVATLMAIGVIVLDLVTK